MIRTYILSLILLTSLTVKSQGVHSFTISGNFADTRFDEFAKIVEAQSGLRFYYLPEQVDSLLLNFGGTKIKVSKVLDELVVPKGIHYLYSDSCIYLTRHKTRKNPLTFVQQNRNNFTTNSIPRDKKTTIEKRYLRAISDISYDTIIVGNKAKGFSAKNAIILGRIVDSKTSAPIIGSTLYLNELQLGAVSNMEGIFNLKIKPGHYSGTINYLNKKEKVLILSIYSDGIFSIELEDKIIPIKEITVVRNKYDKKANMSMGFEHLQTDMLKKLPVLLGEQDLLKAVQMLPGVLSGGEGTAGFYVRGSNADQNLIFFNKVPIYNSSHLFGFFSSFNSNVVSDVMLYKSNIPAQFGGRLASVLDIKAKKGNRKHFNVKGGVSPITGNLLFEGPILKNKGSFVFGVRSSYSDYLLSRLEAPSYSKSDARFQDYTFSASYDVGKNTELSIFSYYSNDHFNLDGINSYKYSNFGNSLIWKRQFSSILSGEIALVDSRYNYETSNNTLISRSYNQKYELIHDALKSSFSLYKFKKHALRAGVDAILYRLDRGGIEPFSGQSLIPEIQLGKEKGIEAAIFLSDKIEINSWLNANLGLRYSYFAILGAQNVNTYLTNQPKNEQTIQSITSYDKNEISQTYSYPELRFSLNSTISELSSVKLAFNQMTQYLFMMSNTVAISPTDQWKLSDQNLHPQRSNQISLGYYKDFLYPAINASVEVYGKHIADIVEYKDGADLIFNEHLEMDVLQGTQVAYGAELMVEKMKGRLTGWFSYAYSRSLITVDGANEWDKINNGIQYPSNYDRPHSFNLASTFKLNRRLSFSSNMVYSTGRPITYPTNIFYINNKPFINYSRRNEYRIPDYFRLDASLNIEASLKQDKFWHSWWSIGVYNMTGRKNAYSVFFKQNDKQLQGYKLSIIGVPVFTVTWNFKLGNYAD